MARSVLERQLRNGHTGSDDFCIATEADDPEIRRLLRENPMPGQISISLEREPNYFADAGLPTEMKQTIVARKRGRVACVGSCVIRQQFVNGEPRRVGYLSGLRLDRPEAGRFDILRRGYKYFREIQADAHVDFFFTSIAADNKRARRFFERGLSGMPRYEFIGEFVTVLMATRQQSREPLGAGMATADLEAFMPILNEQSRRYQFSPNWSANELPALESFGLTKRDFHFIHRNGRVAAGAALWDQRTFRQTVVRGYSSTLRFVRPLLNTFARLMGLPHLPEQGSTLASASVTFLAHTANKPELLIPLLSDLRKIAAQRSLGLLTMGFAGNDPRLATVRKHFRCREYRSRLYLVRWQKRGGGLSDLDGRIVAPEAALL